MKNEVKWFSPSDAGFYYLVKFGLVFIYILQIYREKSSSILVKRKYVQFISGILLLQSMYLLSFWKISLLKVLKLLPTLFIWNDQLLGYYFNIIPNIRIAQFLFFLSFFPVFSLFFYRYFPWQTLKIHKMRRERE